MKRAELRPKLRAPRRAKLLELLDHLQRRTDPAARLEADPLGLVRRYLRPEDRECAAFIAAWLAFGRVSSIRSSIEQVFACADQRGGPRAWIESLDALTERAVLSSFKHRWITGDDLLLGLSGVQALLRRPGGLELAFSEGFREEWGMASALGTGVQLLQDAASRSPLGLELGLGEGACWSRGASFLFSHPGRGGACKRWNMLLRWLVRPEDGVDLGLWTTLHRRDLVLPLDTHTARISKMIGLTKRAQPSWLMAEEITQLLRQLDPEDPVRFDFALAHLGISGDCQGRRRAPICDTCSLLPVCSKGRKR